MPQSARDERLGRRHVPAARPDDLVHARHGRGAVGERGDRVGAADLKDPGDARLDGRRQHRRPRRGQATITSGTPAARAGMAVISSDEGSG